MIFFYQSALAVDFNFAAVYLKPKDSTYDHWVTTALLSDQALTKPGLWHCVSATVCLPDHPADRRTLFPATSVRQQLLC